MTGNGQSHEKDLRPRELRAIAALLSAPTLKLAADAAGLSERTLRRYLAKPRFLAVYETASRGALGAAMQRLHEGMGVAVETFFEIAADKDEKTADRIRAMSLIADLGLRGREFHSFPARLAQLEEEWKPFEPAPKLAVYEEDPMPDLNTYLKQVNKKAGLG